MPIRRIKQSEVPPRRGFNKNPAMAVSAEWKQLGELLQQGQLRAGTCLEVGFGKDSAKLCKKPVVSFRVNFIKHYPPKRFRYQMFTRAGKLYVLAAK